MTNQPTVTHRETNRPLHRARNIDSTELEGESRIDREQSDANRDVMNIMEERSCNRCIHVKMCKLYAATVGAIPSIFPEDVDKDGKLSDDVPFKPIDLAKGCKQFIHIGYVRSVKGESGQPLAQQLADGANLA